MNCKSNTVLANQSCFGILGLPYVPKIVNLEVPWNPIGAMQGHNDNQFSSHNGGSYGNCQNVILVLVNTKTINLID